MAGEEILFFVASRGHHADIGGRTPGSTPPDSRTVEEEGILFDNFKLVDAGVFLEDKLRAHLAASRYPARQPDHNVADLKAQIAAGNRGVGEVHRMIEQFGLDVVHAYMRHVQDNAEEQVRRVIDVMADGEFAYPLDEGGTIRVKISFDKERREATVDFTGTSPQRPTNFNAPSAVCRSAVLYVFRTLVDDNIPLNEGCLKPINIVIPKGCMLAPEYPAAVVAGNTETSQSRDRRAVRRSRRARGEPRDDEQRHLRQRHAPVLRDGVRRLRRRPGFRRHLGRAHAHDQHAPHRPRGAGMALPGDAGQLLRASRLRRRGRLRRRLGLRPSYSLSRRHGARYRLEPPYRAALRHGGRRARPVRPQLDREGGRHGDGTIGPGGHPREPRRCLRPADPEPAAATGPRRSGPSRSRKAAE